MYIYHNTNIYAHIYICVYIVHIYTNIMILKTPSSVTIIRKVTFSFGLPTSFPSPIMLLSRYEWFKSKPLFGFTHFYTQYSV